MSTSGIRLRPASAGAFLRMPASELTGRFATLKIEAPTELPDSAITGAVNLIERSGGAARMDRITQAVNLRARQIDRRFLAAVGLQPKAFARIVRFQAVLAAYRNQDFLRWADLALQCGFYDQAHLPNEFRRFAGAPPTEFFRHPSALAVFINVQFLQDAAAREILLSRPMRYLTLLAALAITAQPKPSFEKLAWIAGNWTGAAGRATIEETWLPPAGGAMLGVSRTLAGPRMVAFEFLRIVQRDGETYYIAQPGGRPPTEFKLTGATGTKAVFENPAHDHPKVITYEKDADGNLVATIEGDERGQYKKQQFRFSRAPTGSARPSSSQ